MDHVVCCECRALGGVRTICIKRRIWHLPPAGWFVRDSYPGDGGLYYLCAACAAKMGESDEGDNDPMRGLELQAKLRQSAAGTGGRMGVVPARLGAPNRVEMPKAPRRKRDFR